ncbi:growth factor receptor domain-containing protein [Calocera viscosa TUFC12733]|uniref:Growth factor receptor domain-containing protein n=1 Tax=Calocera viscosa (strain TUFC12733) TaxID=1330018 RepID=A0A167KXR8_CALVF|nr:growth factor receptor domain-containing protein [Calocera viscosa TUFC12733]
MMLMLAISIALCLLTFVHADDTLTLDALCVAGQCIQGSFNVSLGATLPGASGSKIVLLPDQYTSTNTPQLVRTALGTEFPTPVPGFNLTNTTSLPFTIEPNVAMIAFGGAQFQSRLSSMNPISPSPNTSFSPPNATQLNARSVVMGSGAWAALGSQVGNLNQRTILWETVTDMGELPSGAIGSDLSLLDLQYGTCSPPCSGAGVCTSIGICACPLGFTGASCETCQSGFFGPSCQPCSAGCITCDDGPTGSGKCLSAPTNTSSSCNCLNGVCSPSGTCQCNAGWGPGSNGTACSACAPGFFLDATGSCEVCQIGCTTCSSGSGICTSCLPGFSVSPSDNTACVPSTQLAAATTCPDGQYWSGTGCATCSPVCETCNGPLSTNCVVCGVGRFSFNGTCVSIASDGTCSPPSSSSPATLVANNAKQECDTCPPKCTKCGIPGFNVASAFSSVQCTACLPGYVLSQGQCVSQCPTGTFVSTTDNFSCAACDSSCSTCAGSSTFCLQCSQASQFALNGACSATCPPGTFSSSGACLPCNADCATCSGSSFSQCTSCSASRPVISGQGRCLPTCGQAQYYDSSTSSCQSCDSSCSSCFGPGGSSCLACADKTKVISAGSCVAATCSSNSTVVAALGLCLSDLVTVPSNNSAVAPDAQPTNPNTGTPATLSTVTTQVLAWWQILLMALGGAFILLLLMILWRRWARKRRAQETREFAHDMDRKQWHHRLRAAFGMGREKAPKDVFVEPYRERIEDWELRSLRSEARSQGSRGARSRGSDRSRSEGRRDSWESISTLQLRGATPHSGRFEYRDLQESLRSKRSRLEPREPIRERSLQRLSATSSSYYASTRHTASPSPPRSAPRSERSAIPHSIPRKAPTYPPGFNPQQIDNWLTPNNTGPGESRNVQTPDYLVPLHDEAGASSSHLPLGQYLTPTPTGSSGNTNNPFRPKAF